MSTPCIANRRLLCPHLILFLSLGQKPGPTQSDPCSRFGPRLPLYLLAGVECRGPNTEQYNMPATSGLPRIGFLLVNSFPVP
ncbi:hypothetical protein F5X68DRAFT_210700 [Plectosphaerella plurivora]|uniref:Secreted protein n=1 Tax=Plectosphaerella plurivora TaxID=936078 RepID=A0A9P8V944_9PEZI|nr:hypothetical protein F5X68DRAFT_210700 [Plectosphaerella plurivora]